MLSLLRGVNGIISRNSGCVSPGSVAITKSADRLFASLTSPRVKRARSHRSSLL